MFTDQIAIVTTQQLRAQGWGRAEIARRLESARWRRLRTGYFAGPDAPDDVVRAVLAGGAATGITALRQYGVWTPPDDGVLHVAVSPDSHPPRTDGVELYWSSAFGRYPGTGRKFVPIVPVEAALEHALRTGDAPHAVAMLDSALFTGRLTAARLAAVLEAVPRDFRRRIARKLNAKSESGIESIVRYLLGEAGILCEVQVQISGIGRVDLLIDGWLIIELDGGQHADAAQMRRDRARDAAGVLGGYRTLRFGYDAVMYRWPEVLAVIRTALWQGRPTLAAV